MFASCFSHQLLAQTCGGTIDVHDQKRIGIANIRLSKEAKQHPITRRLVRGSSRQSPRFVTSHWDTVTTLPPSTPTTEVVSFATATYPKIDYNHILVYRDPDTKKVKKISAQVHAEFGKPQARRIVGTIEQAAKKGLTPQDVSAADKRVTTYARQAARNGRRLVRGWVNECVIPAHNARTRALQTAD